VLELVTAWRSGDRKAGSPAGRWRFGLKVKSFLMEKAGMTLESAVATVL